MPISADVFLRDGFAEIQFPDPTTRGVLLGQLIESARAEGAKIRTDSGGARKRYIVPEYIAAAAGLLDDEDDLPRGVPAVVAREWDNPDDAVYDEEPEPVRDVTYPVAPPRPGLRGGTRAAWAAYAEAVGVTVSESMSLKEIFTAVQTHIGA